VKRRILAIGLLLVLFSGSGVSRVSAMEGLGTEELSDYENGEVFVSYRDGSFQVLTYGDDDELAAGLAALERDETVALYQPNYTYQNTGLNTSDTYAGQQWALSNDGTFAVPGRQSTAAAGIDIGVQEAWALYDGGRRDVVIALIDTGVDSSHPDLQNVLWSNAGEIAGNGIDDDGNGYVDDVNGWNFYGQNNRIYVSAAEDIHGTHAAGTIAATADNGAGVAGIVQSSHVKIMVLKALGGAEGTGTTESVIAAIRYAQNNGASICNLSLGSVGDDRALYQTIADSPMLFVVAAGNDGRNTDRTPCYPASYALDNIISVANLNCGGALHESSNYGAVSVDIAAPGTDILSTTPRSRYSYMTGTSMAAPMVSAAAAMLYSCDQDLTLSQVKQILLSSARKLNSLTGKTATGGMLDLGAAMAALTGGAEVETAADPGSAPQIAVSLRPARYGTYLTVAVTDEDGDLKLAAYAAGVRTAEQFQGGRAGQSFSLGADGTAEFFAVGGVYTFYAVDSAGNETVYTVTVTGAFPLRGRSY
jgi:subtilisin family serine protease